MAKSEKEKLSLTSDMDVDTDRPCEADVIYGEEADLHKHLNSCKKNPGHQNFVPVNQFSMEHLPSDYRNNDLLDLIRALSDLTVRLSVKYVFDKRPKTCPGSDASHGTAPRVGTGCVYDVLQSTSQSRCSRCKDSTSSNIEHAMICIRTAVHVVSNEQEAQQTTCNFFFDTGGIPDRCPGVVALTGASYTESNTKDDWRQITYVTCDRGLIDRLKKMLERYKRLEKKLSIWLCERIKERLGPPSYPVVCSEKLLCVIVSHPHGCSKQVSVGYCKSRTMCNETVNSTTLLNYTTATCPGSSGAHIFLLGNYSEEHVHVHNRRSQENNELNWSCVGEDIYYFYDPRRMTRKSVFPGKACRFCYGNDVSALTLLQLPMNTEGQGPWEVEVSYGGETEPHQRYDTCEKNPGHQKCLPVDNLSSQIKNPELLNVILAVSDLTVRVSIKSVSEKRPEDLKFLKTCPGDEQPDSCYRDSTRNMMLKGTGCVAKVIKYENSDEYRTCSCKECQMSQTPKTEFAHIYIRTAIQVVYDNFEAEHSTCDFFFDGGHTPDTCPGVVTLSGVSVEERNKTGVKYFICVTHDLGLADTLTEMINKSELCFKSISDTTKNLSETGSYFSGIEEPIIVVSHPHGCSKKVTVGYQSDDKMYGTFTCPGSAGAPVLYVKNHSVRAYVHLGECEANRDCNHCHWFDYL